MPFPESLTLWLWLSASLVVFVGATIQGIAGYGVTLLGAPVLFLIHPELSPGPVIVVGTTLPLLILLRDWRAIQVRDLKIGIPASFFGAFCALVMLSFVNEAQLALLLGLLVLLAVGLSLVRHVPPPGPRMIAAGSACSGFMTAVTAIGGPPMGLTYQAVQGRRVSGTLSAIFVPTGLFSVGGLILIGRFDAQDAWLGASLLPAVFAGFLLSGRWVNRIPPQALKALVLGISTLAAALILIRNI